MSKSRIPHDLHLRLPLVYEVVLGDLMHNVVDGMLIGTVASTCGSSTVWIVVGSIIAHEVPTEMADAFVLLSAGLTVRQALALNFISSLSALAGCLGILLAEDSVSDFGVGATLIFAAGIFLYIALVELLPQVLKASSVLHGIIPFALGAGIVILSLLIHEDGCGNDQHDHR